MPTYERRRHSLSVVETAPGAVGLWLAEMAFPPAEGIGTAVRSYLDGGDLSYPAHLDFATESLRRWALRRYGWPIEGTDCRWYSGVLHATACAVLALTRPGDAVAVLTPAYPPMLRAVGELGRRLVRWPMAESEAGFRLDTDALAALVERDRPSLLIFNTPHNPTGRVFRPAELGAVGEVLAPTDVAVLSDEVFADVVYRPARHVPFAAAAGAQVAARTLTVLSASKAFNLAGLKCAAGVAGSAELSRRMAAVPAALAGTTSVTGAVASAAAWDTAEDWLDEMVVRFAANRDLLFGTLRDRVPALTGLPPEGTYLAWLTARAGLAASGDVHGELLRRARVDLADGGPFGDESGRRVRICFARPRAELAAALDAIDQACAGFGPARARSRA